MENPLPVPRPPGGFSRRSARFPPRAFAALCLFTFLAFLGLAGCATAPVTPPPAISLAGLSATQQARASENLKIFNRVWSLVADEYYDATFHGLDWAAVGAKYGAEAATAPDPAALYATLHRMLALLSDSHTTVLSPLAAKERRKEAGGRVGIIWLQLRDQWVVNEIVPDSPAALAGVRPGWLLVARDGVPAASRDFRAKPEGEPMLFEFLDEADRPVQVQLARRSLSLQRAPVVRELDDGVLYLRFDQFNATTMRWLSNQLKKHPAAPGVVVDLRRNPGGIAYALEFSVGEFFDHTVSLGTSIDRGGKSSGDRSLQFRSARYRGKVAVLVGPDSGSCSEIFAAVLQEHHRATIVGRPTAGAVLSSWFYPLPDGGELQLSISNYLTPQGRRLEAVGVQPDLLITTPFPTLADFRAGRDLDLEAAVNALKK